MVIFTINSDYSYDEGIIKITMLLQLYEQSQEKGQKILNFLRSGFIIQFVFFLQST